MANGVGASGNVVQPISFDTLEKAKKFAESSKSKGEEVIIKEGDKWVVYDMDDASQVASVKEKIAKLDVTQVEFVGDYDSKTYDKGNAKLKSANYDEAVAMAKLMGMNPPTKSADESEKDFMKRVQREANRQLLLASGADAKPDLIKVDGDIKQETHSAVRAVILTRADSLGKRQSTYDEAYQGLKKEIEAYDKMPCTTADEIKAKQEKCAALKAKKEKLEKDFPGLKADAAAAKESGLAVAATQILQKDVTAIANEPQDPAKLELKEPPKEAPKSEPKKPEAPKTDPEVDFRIKTYLNDAGDGDDDLGQLFARCLAKPQSEWSTSDSKWLLDHGFKPSDLKKIGPEGYARLYAGMMTGNATKQEMLDSFSLLDSASKAGQLGPTLQAIAKLPKGQLDDIYEELGDHGKKADFCKWVMVAQGVDDGTRKTLLEHPRVSKDDLKDAYKWTVENAKIIKDPEAYDALIAAIKAKGFEYKEADAMIKALEAEKAKMKPVEKKEAPKAGA